MVTAVYAAVHFLVDLICAWAMFAFFREGHYENLLIYNFCAFALQMPLGVMLDLARSRWRRVPYVCALIGALVTGVGALLHPVILGLGNALFHVGAGVDVINSDFAEEKRGAYLGMFVAPGAIGLYLGTILGKKGIGIMMLFFAGLFMLGLLTLILRGKPTSVDTKKNHNDANLRCTVILGVCCFAVVILRSWVGLGVSFPWKNSAYLTAAAVCAAALGKLLGGILAVRWGIWKTVLGTLFAAAGCFLLGDIPFFGILAVCLFNMSMPVTLYLLAVQLPKLTGFSFGLLTFGLFLGVLPVYGGVDLNLSAALFGAAGSLLSLVILWTGRTVNRGELSV